MLESFNTTNEMEYQRLSAEEQTKRGILGRLVGVIADFKNATRNGRCYTEKLWDKVFNDPITKEKLASRCIFGELGHPADRQEIDMEKIAICLAEEPKKGNDGKLYGVFDILATPNGRILKTMCDYGCKIGVSSRGGGDTFEDYNGRETVDADTYEFECFDAVLLPAVKAARPKYVTESLHTTKTLKQALTEELERSSDDDKRVMQDTLNELNLTDESEDITDVESNNDVNTDVLNEQSDDIDSNNVEESMAADDIGADLTAELQEALQQQAELEELVRSLQEKLSVCYTKESRYSNRLSAVNNTLALKEAKIAELNGELTAMKEELCKKEVVIESLNTKLTDVAHKNGVASKQLNEQISSKTSEVKKLHETITSLHETYKQKLSDKSSQLEEAVKKNSELKTCNDSLTEEIATLKKDSQIYRTQSTAKLEQSQRLTEKYKGVAKTAVEKYLALQATRLGVSVKDIKQRLAESYSFNDIDKVCENLQQYKLTVNSLPFAVEPTRKVKAGIKESVEPLTKMIEASSYHVDDDVDEVLLSIIK